MAQGPHKTVFRYDRGSLRKPEKTAQGFLRVEGHVARPGIYEYVNTREDEAEGFGKEGTLRRELRPDSEVTSAKSLATLVGAPITNGHPRKNGKRVPVTSENVKDFEVGTVMAARADGDVIAATLLVKDKAAIRAVENGKHELSPGYAVEVEIRSGTDPKYGCYDCVQSDITYNHQAIVDRGRGTTAAKAMRLRMDDGSELVGHVDEMDGRFHRDDSYSGKLTGAVDGHQHLVSCANWDGQPVTSGETSWAMSEGADAQHSHPWVKALDGTITIGESAGHTHPILDENRYASAAGARADEAQIDPSRQKKESERMSDPTIKNREDEVAELRGELTVLTKERDELLAKLTERMDAAEAESVTKERTRADEAEKRFDEYRGSFTTAVRARAELEKVVESVMGPTYRMDGKDDPDLIRAVVLRLDSAIDQNTPIPELRGHFKQLVGRHQRAKEQYGDVAKILGANRNDQTEKQDDKIKHDWDNQHLQTLQKGAADR